MTTTKDKDEGKVNPSHVHVHDKDKDKDKDHAHDKDKDHDRLVQEQEQRDNRERDRLDLLQRRGIKVKSTTVRTINGDAAQDAPAASFNFTVKLTDELGKELMNATPNVKFHNNNVKLDVYEVNPVHTMPYHFAVVLQQPIQKSIIKGDTLYFDM